MSNVFPSKVNLLFASPLQYYHIAINIDGAYSFEAEALT